MSLPPDFLDELRTRVSLAQVVGRRVRLQRKGREFLGLCPFHNEKTPSFSVVEDKGFYHCFGCGAHGDVLSFVMETEGLAFREAVERLAGEAGLSVPAPTPAAAAEERRRAGLHDVIEMAAAWFQTSLAAPVGEAARAYLQRRGLGQAALGRFRLGYAPGQRGRLQAALAAQGVEPDQMVEAGLLKRPDEGGPLRDYFLDRVVFPIADRRGRLVAFGGRTLGDGQPKYLNSPDGPLFHKGRLLYNLDAARVAARSGAQPVVVEGYMDVIALAEAGIEGAVAPLGTAITEEQLLELWRLAPEPLLCLDGDAAGRRAALRAAARALPLLEPGRSLGFVFLPAGEDPDSLVRKAGVEAFARAAAAARPLVEIVWEEAMAGRLLDTPERWAAAKATLTEQAERIRHAEVQRLYRSDLLDRFYALRRDRRPGGPRRGGADRRPLLERPVPRPRPEAVADRQEGIVLALVLNHPALLCECLEELVELPLQGEAEDRLRRGLLDLLAESPTLDSEAVKSHLSQLGFGDALSAVLSPAVYALCAAARPEAPQDQARRALKGTLATYAVARARLALAEAEHHFAEDPSEASLLRVRAIQRHLQDAEARRDEDAAA